MKQAAPRSTREKLLDAARRLFNSDGFLATDTNKIARAAGFAPQTFYRHFGDKTEAFLEVYDTWWKSELAALGQLRQPGSAEKAAQVTLAFHRRWRIFRRSLRHL